jgi:hypothetical protein
MEYFSEKISQRKFYFFKQFLKGNISQLQLLSSLCSQCVAPKHGTDPQKNLLDF